MRKYLNAFWGLLIWMGTGCLLSPVVFAAANTLSMSPENIRFKHIMGNADGEVSFAGINTIIQDSKGFMWFGTENGLIRYDGKNAVVYEHNPNNPRSLSDSFVFSTLIDHDNFLWVGTESGLNRYNSSTNDFDRFEHNPSNPNSISHNKVRAIMEARDHSIYVATFGGLDVISPDRKSISHYTHNNQDNIGLAGDLLRKVFEDAAGNIWIGSMSTGLQLFNPRTKTFTTFQNNPSDEKSLSRNDVRDIAQDKWGRIWVATDGGGLNRLNDDGKTFTRYTFLNNPKGAKSLDIVFSILSDSQGNLWAALNQSGIAFYDFNADSFTLITHDPYDSSSLLKSTVKFIYEDRMGDLWIPSFPVGINFFNRSSIAFKNYYNKTTDPRSLSDSAVLYVTRDSDGDMWVGTENGLNLYNPKADNFTRYMHDNSNPNSLPANAVLSLLQDAKHRYWVGTWAGGLAQFDKKTGNFRHFPNNPGDNRGPNSNHIWSLLEDNRKDIWVGTQTGGLNLYDPVSATFKSFSLLNNPEHDGNGDFIICLLQDRNGWFWVGSSAGAFLFDRETKTFNRQFGDAKGWEMLKKSRVVALYEDNRGDIWLATTGTGLVRYNRKKNLFEFLRVDDSLPSDAVASVIGDDLGYIWAGTAKGLARINPQSFEVVATFNSSNGLRNDLFNRNAAYKDPSGKLYFGGVGSLIKFDPQNVESTSAAAPIAFTDFRIFNKTQIVGASDSPLKKDINETKLLELSASDSVFSIDFAALNYRESKKNRYGYMLEGFDKDWALVVDHHSATYTNLDPGTYTFKVREMQKGAPKAEGGRDITIIIRPPHWRTWWAYTLYGIILIVLFYLVERISLRRSLAQEQHRLLEIASFSDPLTQLNNRRYLLKQLPNDIAVILRQYEEEGQVREQEKGRKLIFFMVDIDRFKSINDTYGHSTGDLVLAQFAQVMQSVFRESDYLVRWGGEEFLVVGRFMKIEEAALLSERLRTRVAQTPFTINSDKSLQVTCSIGFASFPFDLRKPQLVGWQKVVDIADACLYAAKHSGRNTWVGLHRNDLHEAPLNFNQLLTHIPQLISAGKLVLETSSPDPTQLHWGNGN